MYILKYLEFEDRPFSEFYGLPQNNNTLVALGAPSNNLFSLTRVHIYVTQIQISTESRYVNNHGRIDVTWF